jgi:hypothetical protein
MREPDCELEQAVIGALASGQLTSQLQAHVEGCVSCRDAVGVSHLLQKLIAEPRPRLPAASYVWWKSRMRQRRAAQRRVTKLIAITQTATVAVAIIGLAIWIILHRSEVGEEIRTSLNSFFAWSSSGLASSGVVLVYLSIALLLVNVLLTVRAARSNNKE